MRRCLCLFAVGLLLASVADAWSQSSRFLGAGSHASSLPAGSLSIINKPINTDLSVAPLTSKPSFLSGLFRKPTMPGFPPVVGQSNLPSPSSFPSTKYPNTFKPLVPVIPTN